jgi:hypothetical protein
MNHHLMLLCLQLKMLQCVARYVNNVKIFTRGSTTSNYQFINLHLYIHIFIKDDVCLFSLKLRR